MDDLQKLIREIPDYPRPGILFYDLTTLLQDPRGFHSLVDRLCEHYSGNTVDIVVGIEARTASVTYQLEYGSDQLEIHHDAVRPGQRVLLCDDLLATGGTAAAAINLVRQLGGEVVGAAFAVELNFLHGRVKLPDVDVFSLLKYDK
jgi:adenine phosphoribosyltransferase